MELETFNKLKELGIDNKSLVSLLNKDKLVNGYVFLLHYSKQVGVNKHDNKTFYIGEDCTKVDQFKNCVVFESDPSFMLGTVSEKYPELCYKVSVKKLSDIKRLW